MKRIKRIFCILVAVAMTLTAFDASAQGQSVRPGKRIENRSKPKQTPRGSSKQNATAQTKRYTANGVSFYMVKVPSSTFVMGGTSEQGGDAESDEYPTHTVTLSSYMIGQTEVTQELWVAVMGSNPSHFRGPKLPVENVSWYDCQAFINRLNSLTGERFRLPTEAEWECAAREGRSGGTVCAGGNNITSVGWGANNSYQQTQPVGMKNPNALGIYDMSGNVWEWCYDWYGSYSSSSQTDPKGPSDGSNRMLRGGGWNGRTKNCRVSNRDGRSPSYKSDRLGLRLAR